MGSALPCRRKPNARRELRLEAGARHERTLEAVSSTPLFGAATPLVPSFARLPALSDSGRPESPARAAAIRAESERTSTDTPAAYAPCGPPAARAANCRPLLGLPGAADHS